MSKPVIPPKTSQPLIFAIIFAAILIAGALVFAGTMIRRQNAAQAEQLAQRLKTEILAEAQKQSPKTQELDIVQKTKEAVLTELRSGDFFDQQVDAGIQRFLEKQQEAQMQAEAERERVAQENAKNVRPVSADRDHIYGSPDAVISIIEFADFECPFCKGYHDNTTATVKLYDGKVNWVYRHFPLQFHNPGAQKEAEASECVAELGGNDAFWNFAATIYQRTTSNGKGIPLESLAPLAEELGVEKAAFQACLDSGKYAQRVREDFEDGMKSGISGTPGSIIINHQTNAVSLKSGALTVDMFKQVIDEMLK